MTRAVVVPSAPLLLPAYAGRVDPAPELRSACLAAVGWLVEDAPRRVLALVPPADPANVARGVSTPLGRRVADELLHRSGFAGDVVEDGPVDGDTVVLVVADGSARRGEQAPGYLDDRAVAFDTSVGEALMLADSSALESLDIRLGAELLAQGVPALQRLGALDLPVDQVDLDYAGDPFGVQYWVVRWHCAS